MEIIILNKCKTCVFTSILRSKFQQGLCSKVNMLLSSADETGIGFLQQAFGAQAQVSGAFAKTYKLIRRGAQKVPMQSQCGGVEVVTSRWNRPGLLRQIGTRISKFDSSRSRTHNRPAFFPAHWG